MHAVFIRLNAIRSSSLSRFASDLGIMVVSPALHARRAFVKVMIALATVYGVLLGVTRDSPDAVVVRAHKKLLRKVHPDEGGTKEHTQQL